MVDITEYLTLPTAAEERMVNEMQRIVAAYTGPRAYKPGILIEYGWSEEDSERVFDLARRVMIQ